jgi:purine-binding chemotaxis protein CheW
MSEGTADQIVVFSLGDDEYALPIGQVQEIIRYTEPRSVASDAPWIRGVISLRGKIVPVCDLSARLGTAPGQETHGNIVIVEAGDATAGILVDDVDEVLTIGHADLEDVPATGSDAMRSIAKIGDRLVVLLDAQTVFGNVDLGIAA